jgi:hypothetical protein
LKDEEKRLSSRLATLEKEEKEAAEKKAAQDFEKRKPELVAKWKTKLIDDLNTGAYRSPITMGVTTHDGILKADDREITLRIGQYGGAPFGWDKFQPPLLLQIARAFIKPDAPDAAERQWLSAVYAQSTGQNDVARELAQEAAKARPEYREQIRWLIPRS